MHAIALAGVSPSYITGFFYSTIPNMCTRLYFQFDLCLLENVVYVCVSLHVFYVFPRAFGCCILWLVVVFVFLKVYSVFGICAFPCFFCVRMLLLSWAFRFLATPVLFTVQFQMCVYNVVFPVRSLFGKECCSQMCIFTHTVRVSACFHSLHCVIDCRVYVCVVGVPMLSI